MKVSSAVDTRMSCRAFLPTPIALATVREILDAARRAPSGGNLQPWSVHVLTSAPLAELREDIQRRLVSSPRGEGAEYEVYPPQLTEPYLSRRFKCGEDLYAAIGIPREDKVSRVRQFKRNYLFFDAPVGMFVFIDRQMGRPQWCDLGIYLQTIMLLAREHGLHTCPQEAWAVWHAAVSERLGIPANMMLFCGLALGIRDETAAVSAVRTDRAPLEELVTFHGF
jgi:nitroreductase